MNKVILIIDAPECCDECPLCCPKGEVMIEPYVYRHLFSCKCVPEGVTDIYIRDISMEMPEWCPLREIPKKKKVDIKRNCDYEESLYASGYNAAIDEIMKGAPKC